MKTYIVAFIFYTLAMIGVLFFAFIIYKKTMFTTQGKKRGSMKILESLPISPKKTLLIVKVENRKILIASGMEHTTFLADLTNDEVKVEKEEANIPIEKFENDSFIELKKDEDFLKGSSRKKMIRKILQNLKSSDTNRSNRF